MKRLMCVVIGCFMMSMAVNAAASPDPKQVSKDWVEMDKLLTERDTFLYQHEFDKEPEGFADRWVKFKDALQKKLSEFEDKYGTDRNILTEMFKGVSKPPEAKRDTYDIVSGYLFALSDIESQNKNIIDWAERLGNDQYSRWEQFGEPDKTKVELKYRYAKDSLKAYRAAARLNPEGDYREQIKKSEAAEKESKALYLKNLESIAWPGHNNDFEGPGNPRDLASAALDFLRKNPNWSKPEYDDEHIPYAAAVTGKGWEVWKRAPITNQTTQYSIDMTVAFEGKKKPDIVYVYNMVFYTAEEAGVKKELPFRYANSKLYQKHEILKKSIPKSAVTTPSKRSQGTGDVSTSSFGFWRLIFSLLLIAGGAVGAQVILVSKIPNLKPFIEKLTGFIMPLGLILVLFGLIGFLGNLFRLSPLASLLPQAAAVCLGLIFLKKVPGPIPANYLDKIKGLEPFEMPLGMAAMVLGILHLFMGGTTLF